VNELIDRVVESKCCFNSIHFQIDKYTSIQVDK